jgi:hypothetical protein
LTRSGLACLSGEDAQKPKIKGDLHVAAHRSGYLDTSDNQRAATGHVGLGWRPLVAPRLRISIRCFAMKVTENY